jgi:hypothetical protein
VGELYVGANGVLYFCTKYGTPGVLVYDVFWLAANTRKGTSSLIDKFYGFTLFNGQQSEPH